MRALHILNGGIQPGDTRGRRGCRPHRAGGSPRRTAVQAHIVAIDLVDARLESAKQFGADVFARAADTGALKVVLTGAPA